MKITLLVLLHAFCALAGFWLAHVSPGMAVETSSVADRRPAAKKTPAALLSTPPASPPKVASEAGLVLLTSENWAEAISPIAELPVTELPALLRGLMRNPFPQVRRRLLQPLFERWFALDQAGAIAAMRGITSPQMKASALRDILHPWSKINADAAWQYVTSLEDDTVLQEAGIETLLAIHAGDDPQRYAAWAAQLDDVFLREKALEQISSSWMQKDPQAALAAALTAQPVRLRDLLLSKFCYRDTIDHAAGLEIVAQLPSANQRRELSAEWISGYAHSKPQEAYAWLLAHADNSELQKASRELGRILAGETKNFTDLRAQAAQLPAGPLRDAFAAHAAEIWASEGHSLAQAEDLLSLCGPCLERADAQSIIDSKRSRP
jgi:hypothetical protein